VIVRYKPETLGVLNIQVPNVHVTSLLITYLENMKVRLIFYSMFFS
jgi:hypothetical protein